VKLAKNGGDIYNVLKDSNFKEVTVKDLHLKRSFDEAETTVNITDPKLTPKALAAEIMAWKAVKPADSVSMGQRIFLEGGTSNGVGFQLAESGALIFHRGEPTRQLFTAKVDPGVFNYKKTQWGAWEVIKGVLLEALAAMETGDEAKRTLNEVDNGGIDLNGNAMGLDVAKSGQGVTMIFDAAMADRFRRGDFTGLTPVIIRITPIVSPAAMLGMQIEEPSLASS
jgi:hypothetical protein